MSCKCGKAQETIDALKVRNSRPSCGGPLWSEDGSCCIIYVSCGDPCEKPCELCLVWTGYGAAVYPPEESTHE